MLWLAALNKNAQLRETFHEQTTLSTCRGNSIEFRLNGHDNRRRIVN
jgi:hypothetical protein